MSECASCKAPIEKRLLSGLGTCPNCVKEWVREYKSYHDRRYGKRIKATH